MHTILEIVIGVLHNAGRRQVYIKTDGYVPACLNPGDMDFAERFPADWLANYIHQEAELGLSNQPIMVSGRKVCNLFFIFQDFNTVLHVSAYRDQQGQMEYALTV